MLTLAPAASAPRMRKWEQTIGGEKKAVLTWDLEGEQQPFVGENSHD